MTSIVRICLVLFVLNLFNGSRLGFVDTSSNKYFSLITDVHKYYGTSSVFFIFSNTERHIEEYTFIHKLCREFSKKGVLTLMIRFDNLERRSKFYRKQIGRPLVVVIIKSVSDVAEFYAYTEAMNKSYSMWLVIFVGEFDKTLCEYCNDPRGNILGVQFNTAMLVKCCDNRLLSEWWSVNGNRTEMADFAVWTESEGLTVLAIEALYARRHDINGTGLRVGLVAKSALVVDYGHEVGGFFGDILQEISRVMNFSITMTLREEVFGSFNSATKNWSGLIGQLVRKNADLGAAEFAMTNARLDVVDYSLPLLVSRSKLYIREPGASRLQWSAYFEAFRFEIWLTIIIILITTPILLTVIKIKKSSMPLPYLIGENYLHVLGIFCQQGLSEFPAESPLRIAYFSIFMSALVVYAAYSAALISFLTVTSISVPYSNMADFVNDGSYKLIVYRNSAEYDFFATSNDIVLRKMMTLMKPLEELPKSLEEAFGQVCKQRVAFYTNEIVKSTLDAQIKCKVAGIPTGRMDSLAMVMPVDSQYTGLLNYHIHRFRDNGMMKRLKEKNFIKGDRPEVTHYGVGVRGVAPILAVLGGGIILAIVMFFCEKICHSLAYYVQRWAKWLNGQKSKMHRWCKFREKQRLPSGNRRVPLQRESGKMHKPHTGY